MSKDLLEQAIEKLERLKAESTQGEWRHYQDNEHYSTISPVDDLLDIAHIGLTSADGELIVTLHRTIDPILDMLEHCVQWLNDAEHNGLSSKSPIVEVEIEAEVNIAKAILGVE